MMKPHNRKDNNKMAQGDKSIIKNPRSGVSERPAHAGMGRSRDRFGKENNNFSNTTPPSDRVASTTVFRVPSIQSSAAVSFNSTAPLSPHSSPIPPYLPTTSESANKRTMSMIVEPSTSHPPSPHSSVASSALSKKLYPPPVPTLKERNKQQEHQHATKVAIPLPKIITKSSIPIPPGDQIGASKLGQGNVLQVPFTWQPALDRPFPQMMTPAPPLNFLQSSKPLMPPSPVSPSSTTTVTSKVSSSGSASPTALLSFGLLRPFSKSSVSLRLKRSTSRKLFSIGKGKEKERAFIDSDLDEQDEEELSSWEVVEEEPQDATAKVKQRLDLKLAAEAPIPNREDVSIGEDGDETIHLNSTKPLSSGMERSIGAFMPSVSLSSHPLPSSIVSMEIDSQANILQNGLPPRLPVGYLDRQVRQLPPLPLKEVGTASVRPSTRTSSKPVLFSGSSLLGVHHAPLLSKLPDADQKVPRHPKLSPIAEGQGQQLAIKPEVGISDNHTLGQHPNIPPTYREDVQLTKSNEIPPQVGMLTAEAVARPPHHNLQNNSLSSQTTSNWLPTPLTEAHFQPFAAILSPTHPIDRFIVLTEQTSPDELMDHLQSISAEEVRSHLARILTNRHCYKAILAWRGGNAQSMINLLQTSLGHFPPDSHERRLLLRVLLKLSRASGLYPECLVRDDIQLLGTDPVAAGRFGDVWMGSMPNQELIAVKIVRVYVKSDLEKLLRECSAEAVTWQQLSHPNVLPFHGIFHLNKNRNRICLISPWMKNGNIIQYLQIAPHANRLSLILDVARGLEYLHSFKPTIIHGDLKGVNILITPDCTACLADFGLASVEDSQAVLSSVSTCKISGTSRWQAPELLDPQSPDFENQGRNSLASDIYSFGCVCYEIYSGHVPFYEIPKDVSIILAVTRGQRPSQPLPEQQKIQGDAGFKVWRVIQACWDHRPSQRPNTSQIIKILVN